MGSELYFGVVFGMGECTEFHIDGVCSEFGFGSFPEMRVGDCVPLHSGVAQSMLQIALARDVTSGSLPHVRSMSRGVLSSLSRSGRAIEFNLLLRR